MMTSQRPSPATGTTQAAASPDGHRQDPHAEPATALANRFVASRQQRREDWLMALTLVAAVLLAALLFWLMPMPELVAIGT
jgi:ferric-dicitrate binding protein FerR (iron transport regulator)